MVMVVFGGYGDALVGYGEGGYGNMSAKYSDVCVFVSSMVMLVTMVLPCASFNCSQNH